MKLKAGCMAKDERFPKNENHVTDGICFHCQQAVEKYLNLYHQNSRKIIRC